LDQKKKRGVGGEETVRGRKKPEMLRERKLTQTERKSGGMDFEGRKRHGAERKPPRLFR
ncbi:hypothetical protein T11_16232, partial [Trichinella zimbabwensis]